MYLCNMKHEKDSDYWLKRYEIVLRKNYGSCVQPYATSPLMYKGNCVGYYYPDGYYYLSAYLGKNLKDLPQEKKDRIVKRTAINVSLMNGDKDFSVVVAYLLAVFKERVYGGTADVDKGLVEHLVSNFHGGAVEPKYSVGKYMFNDFLPLDVKRRVMALNNSNGKSAQNFGLVERAVQFVCEEDEYADVFVTAKTIHDCIDGIAGQLLSEKTINKYLRCFREEIDEHNEKSWGCHSFTMYQRMLSVHKIVESIKTLSNVTSRISKRSIEKESGLHYNTILNLWLDDKVQEELDKYNQTVMI